MSDRSETSRSRFCRGVVAAAIAAGAALVGTHAMADDPAPASEPVNTGQDVTNPVQRIDLRANFTIPGASGGSAGDLRTYSFVARYDRPIILGDGWKVGLRFDVPFVFNNVPSPDNPAGEGRVGYGDTLAQALLIKSIDERQAFGFGTQIIAPTAAEDQFGSGRWRLVPTVGYRYALPEISPGSFFAAALRYDFDIAGSGDRKHISNLQFAPTLNIALPNTSFLTFWPATDIRYDFTENSLFVPFDVQIGKVWNGSVVTSLEVGFPIYKGSDPLYDFKTEARIGFFF